MTTPSMFERLPGADDAEFDGPGYDPVLDKIRLSRQMSTLYDIMCDGEYRTLRELAARTGYSETSISARLRDFRKEKFGSFGWDARRRGDPKSGLWEYMLGKKGAGDPQTRDSAFIPYNEAIRAADLMVPYLRHTHTCPFVTKLMDSQCLCGLDEIKAMYRNARRGISG